MNELEIVNTFIRQLPKVTEAVSKLKTQSEEDIVRKYQLNKQIEVTEEMKRMGYEELVEHLENKYDKMNEIQMQENERKKLVNDSVVKQINELLLYIKQINEYDDINVNNVSIVMNKIVDMMIENENKYQRKETNAMNSKHSEQVSEMNNSHTNQMNRINDQHNKVVSEITNKYNKEINEINTKHNEMVERMNKQRNDRINEIKQLRKKTTSNEIIDLNKRIILKKLHDRGNNEYVYDNFNTLEDWCGHRVNAVLYDSLIDGKDGYEFRNRILNHQHLYFIVVDDKNNVFGHYHNSSIRMTAESIEDPNIFLFTLNSNGRCGIKKFEQKYKSNVFTKLYKGNNENMQFYYCGETTSKGTDFYGLFNIMNSNGIIQDINHLFEGLRPTDLTGFDCNKTFIFNPKRVIVMEMI